MITSGLLRALQGKGIEDIVEAQYTGRKILAHQYLSSYGAGDSTPIDDSQAKDVMFPEIEFLTNDSWALVRALAAGRGYPLLFMNRYSKGALYVWAIPDNANDLYRLPVEVTSALKNYIMQQFPVRMEGAAQVALFAYDNNTFIVESYLPSQTGVKIFVAGSPKLKNLITGETFTGESHVVGSPGRGGSSEPRTTFNVNLLPHSYSVFAIEK